MIPARTRRALAEYIDRRLMPGSFLQAVLANDLQAAAMRADDANRAALADIAEFVWDAVPVDAWGSKDAVRQWCEAREDSE